MAFSITDYSEEREKWDIVFDYRKLNAIGNKYQIPNILEISD